MFYFKLCPSFSWHGSWLMCIWYSLFYKTGLFLSTLFLPVAEHLSPAVVLEKCVSYMESLHSDLTLKVVECAEECYSRVTVQLQWKTCEKFGIQVYSWKPYPSDHSKDWKGGVFWGWKRFDYIPQVKNYSCNALPKNHQFKTP